MTTALLALLNADLAQESKATPAPWRIKLDRVVSAPYGGENFATGGSYVAISIGTQDDREELATARNHHKPYVVALLKIAEWKCPRCDGKGEAAYLNVCCDTCAPIYRALAELAEALSV